MVDVTNDEIKKLHRAAYSGEFPADVEDRPETRRMFAGLKREIQEIADRGGVPAIPFDADDY